MTAKERTGMRSIWNRKRMICVLLAAAIFFCGSAFTAWGKPAWPSDTGIQAEAGIAVDADSGAVLFGQNIHKAYAPASITKLLTALVVAENASLDDTVVFSHDAVYNVESGSGNSLALDEGDELSVRDCLHALLLRSSNQAANALAEHVAGSRDAFVDMMNEKIAQIGCTESHFANPSGLNDSDQYVTAYDMALIARAAFENETVLAVDSARTYTLPATSRNPDGLTISMEHRILAASDNPSSSYYLEGAVGGKTGYTSIAGNTLVTYARRDGRGVISVILKGKQPQYYYDGKNLIEFGFASFRNETISDNETLLTEQDQVTVGEKTYETSELYVQDGAVVTLPLGASFSDVTRSVNADISDRSSEEAVASLIYTYDERTVGSALLLRRQTGYVSVDVSSGETEESSGETEVETNAPGSSRAWVVALVMILLLAAAALGVFAVWHRQKKEQELLAMRRARRRQRLRELGYDEGEFERMVKEREEASKNSGRR